nr:NAC transcription factor [Ipomoea batatas]
MEIPLGLRFQPFDYDVIRLKKKAKSMKGSRVQRTVGRKMMEKQSGNWHGQDKGKAVVDKDGKFLMGYKRSFVYKNESEPEQNGQWLLKEFYLPETIIRRARAEFRIVEEREDFVLLEQGGTSSKDSEAVPVPVESSDDDAINSCFVGVPMETAIVEGVPVETLLGPTDNISSYIVGIPEDTIAEGVPVETLLAPPAIGTDGGSYLVETSSEPSSFMDFSELIWNIEDVTTLIDFDA